MNYDSLAVKQSDSLSSRLSPESILSLDHSIPAELTDARILIIDSIEQTRTLLHSFFVNSDYKNCFTTNWDNPYEAFLKENPDIIIPCIYADCGLNTDFFEMLVHKRSMVESILITDSREIKASFNALPLGVCEIILMPICIDELESALSRAYKRLKENLNRRFIVSQFDATIPPRTPRTEPTETIDKRIIQGIIHNLNSPLSVMSGNAQLLEAGMAELENLVHSRKIYMEDSLYCDVVRKIQTFRHYVGNLMESDDKMKDILTSFLSKWRKDHSDKIEYVDLNEFLRLEMKYLDANLDFKNQVTKIVECQENLPKIKGRYSDFSQVFHNLISNALDAMETSDYKELALRCHQQGEEIRFEIEDNGCGISEDNIQNIFKPFFTTKSADDETQRGGTGFGLYNCVHLMDPYGGRFEVSSELGFGTKITWIIPLTGLKEVDVEAQSGERSRF
ncbi:MAG: sensor histidine kinase [Candidatus Auribacter fodinae]|uniref:histidine kinase n=1 Tax=Candidatus Auribacter fodinae TaxID=2093366 RepID=A0A3A4QZF8_9BACT|nr:MAG: sensor histidine kinase [Candidatus Auribacter fodinae]